MKKLVPEILRDLVQDATRLRDVLTVAVRNVTWAYQDLLRSGQLPDGSNEPELPHLAELPETPEARDAILAEFATRVVLPSCLGEAEYLAGGCLDLIQELQRLVPPLPPAQPDKEDVACPKT